MVKNLSRILQSSRKDDSDQRADDQTHTRLLHWDDVPHWQQDNHHIRGSYRRPSGSYKGSLSSLLYTHNETVNIYSHLTPALAALPFAFVLYGILQARYAEASKSDILAFGCFFLGVTVCLGTSATYHTISNHSPAVNRVGNQLDYVGIVLLITGSFIPSIHYGFWCNANLKYIYWTMICFLGAGCTAVSVMTRFRTPTWRPFRAGMFVSMGLSAVFPVLHGVQLYGIPQMRRQIGLVWLVLQGALYILGATIYAARVPEKWCPGRHDIWGSSHQIFHILVVLAASSHVVGLVKAVDYRHGLKGGSCS